MSWKKAEPWAGTIQQGCLHAPVVEKVASLDLLIAVGFGDAQVTRDGTVVYSEMDAADESFHYLREFEALAKLDPDHDWRVLLDAPLRSEEYQRHGDDQWVLINSGMGFA
jgi:hypothetical protein